jgi:(2R)-sulfolactate sulfo-lyase subunit alpha
LSKELKRDKERQAMTHKFLVHAKEDDVGVAVEDIRTGEMVVGFILEDESTVTVKVLQDIPLGHKIALTSLAAGATVKKYGEAIGKAVTTINPGDHVHVHNLKSARW